MMSEEQKTEAGPEKADEAESKRGRRRRQRSTAAAPEAGAVAEQAADETEAKPTGRSRKTHGERAVANLRTAKRSQREGSEENERVQFLLAEANVLALLDLADAIRGQSNSTRD